MRNGVILGVILVLAWHFLGPLVSDGGYADTLPPAPQERAGPGVTTVRFTDLFAARRSFGELARVPPALHELWCHATLRDEIHQCHVRHSDQQSSQQVLEVLQQLHRRKAFALVLVTHDPQVASWAQRVVTLVDGKVTRDEAV